MKAKYVSLVPLIVLALLLVTVGQVQAKELLKVTIAGPALNGEIELNDTKSLKVIRELGFADQIYQPTSVETEPYFEIRIALGDGTEIVATSVYHYYPASKEHPGYIYYADGINAWSSRDRQYFLLPEDTDRALRDLLISLGASLRGPRDQLATTLTIPLLWFILGGCFCISIEIAIRLKRPSAHANN